MVSNPKNNIKYGKALKYTEGNSKMFNGTITS